MVTLTRIKELIDANKIKKTLVIAPKRVAEDTWSRECEKWDHLNHLRISKVLGPEKTRNKALDTDADIYVINRENVQWLVETIGMYWPFDAVVIDELSSFKSAQSKRWRMLKRVIKLSPYVYGLTGTPAPNGYLDLWPQIYLIDNGAALGSTMTRYRSAFFMPGARKGQIVYEWHLEYGAKEKIDSRLKGICLSMSKEDWITLPPITYNNLTCKMDKKERDLYDRFLADHVIPLISGKVVDDIEGADSALVGASAATVSGKLLQMANGACYDTKGDVVDIHDHKLDVLEELVEAAQGQPILVFYSYQHDLYRLRERFPQGAELVSSAQIQAWNKGNIPILFTHPAAAGHGLNLQEGGHIIVWFGLPWSLELYQQANARLYRQGQTNPVIVHHILCENTLDERVLTALQSKDSTQRSLLDALKTYVKETI